MIRWTLRNQNSTAIGGKAHIASAEQDVAAGQPPEREPASGPITDVERPPRARRPPAGPGPGPAVGGYQYAYGVIERRGRVVQRLAVRGAAAAASQ